MLQQLLLQLLLLVKRPQLRRQLQRLQGAVELPAQRLRLLETLLLLQRLPQV